MSVAEAAGGSFVPSPEQEELARTCRRFVESRAPVSAARRLMEEGEFDRAVWLEMANGLGLQGLLVPAELGGAAAGMSEAVIALEELGRVLYTGPFIASSVLATSALLAAGDGADLERHLPALARGEQVAALAFGAGPGAEGAVPVLATEAAGAWSLSGKASYVLHGTVADLLVVAAGTPVGSSLFAVDATAAGVHRRALPVLDQTRPLATVELTEAPGRPIGGGRAGEAGLASALEAGMLALAASALGTASASLDMALEYAQQREQFDRPIGSFQAIKHRLADMLLELELARSAVIYASRAVDVKAEDASRAVHIAKAQCSEAAFRISAESIQIHGGVGFTWEHDAHLYFKRARADASLLGTPDWHRERVLQGLGL